MNLVSYVGVKLYDSRRERDNEYYKVLTAILMDLHFTTIVITELDDGQNAYNFMFWCNLIDIWYDVLAIQTDSFHLNGFSMPSVSFEEMLLFPRKKMQHHPVKFMRMRIGIIGIFTVDLLIINAIYFTMKILYDLLKNLF